MGRVVEERNTDQQKKRVLLIWDLKPATPSPAKQGSSNEFQNWAHAGTNYFSNYKLTTYACKCQSRLF